MNNKFLTLLGFAAKAGKLSFGMEAVKYSLLRKKAKLVVVSDEISEKSRKEVGFYCTKNSVKFITLENTNIATLSSAVGRKCGIISVNDSSFADAILNALNIHGGNANDK